MDSCGLACAPCAWGDTYPLTLRGAAPNINQRAERKHRHTFFDTTDTLLGAVPWTKRRMVLVFLREHGCRRYVQMRTFNQHQTKGCWYPTGRFYTVPIECAETLGKALLTAAHGRPFGKPPDWYSDFQKQYEALKAQAKAKRRSGRPAGNSPVSGDGLVAPMG